VEEPERRTALRQRKKSERRRALRHRKKVGAPQSPAAAQKSRSAAEPCGIAALAPFGSGLIQWPRCAVATLCGGDEPQGTEALRL
jgi:hypothetical protein